MPARISIAMATYNGSRFLQEQLDSLRRQTVPPYELIIQDDGSTDNTIQIARNFASQAPFPVKIFENDKHLGYCENFLTAATHGQGDWIAFCDQDDVWRKDKIACITTAIDRNPDLNVFIHDSIRCNETLHPRKLFLTSRTHGIYRTRVVVPPFAFQYRYYSGHCTAIRASLLDLLNDLRLALAGEVEITHDRWTTILAYAMGKVYFCNKPLVLYRRHSGAVFASDRPFSVLQRLAYLRTTSYNLHLIKAVSTFSDVAEGFRKLGAPSQDRSANDLLLVAADHFDQVSRWYRLRAHLYHQAGSFRNRARAFIHCLRSGCYWGKDGVRGLGTRQMIRDLIPVLLGTTSTAPE